MSDNNKTGKLNNKGFSLVELIIAIMILAIVTGPMLSCFITAFKLNMYAKENMRQSAAAQSVMEGMKAYDIEELEKQFLSTSAGDFKVYNAGSLSDVADSATIPSVSGWSCELIGKDGNPVTDPLKVNDVNPVAQKTFSLTGLEYQGGTYDVKVTATYNTKKEVMYIENMNGFKDCIYEENLDDTRAAYSYAQNAVLEHLNSIDWIYGYANPVLSLRGEGYKLTDLDMSKITATRTTTVTITDSKVNVSVTIKMKMDHYPYYNSTGAVAYESYTSERTLTGDYYDNSLTGATLENIFLFVYPAYKSSLAGYPINRDSYVITSNTDRKVYFVKQKNDTLTEASLSICENGYFPEFSINNVQLYHNLRDNLAGGNVTGYDHISITGTSSIQEGLSYKNDQVFIYDLNVAIYEAVADPSVGFDGREVLYELNGTMNGH